MEDVYKIIGWAIVPFTLYCSGCNTTSSAIPIHNDPFTSIWLTFDKAGETPHRHPYTLTADAMAKILAGVQVEERDTISGLGLFGSKDDKPAFSQGEIGRLGRHLIEALKKASPKDMATFYMVVSDANHKRSITSGGMFVDSQGRMHITLANWRSTPSGGQDYTTAMEVDTRDEPLLPISPFRFRVGFQPNEAWLKTRQARGEARFPAYRSAYGDPAKSIVIELDYLLKQDEPH